MPMQLHTSESETPSAQLKALIVGLYGAGKSKLASTARKPILVLDYDSKPASYAGVKDCYVVTLTDPAVGFQQPTVMNNTWDILTQLETSEGSLASLGFEPQLAIGATVELPKVRTLVCDSLQSFAKGAMRFVLQSNPKLAREIPLGNLNGGQFTVRMPHSFDGWGGEMNIVEATIVRMLALPLDVIITSHEVPEETPDSTDENVKLTGKVQLFPRRYNPLLRLFTEKWRVERFAGASVPQVHMRSDLAFNVSSELNVDAIETEPDIEKILAKHTYREAQRCALAKL